MVENPVDYWYQKYLSIKKTLDLITGGDDFIAIQNGEILSSMNGDKLSAKAILPKDQSLFKFGDRCKIIVIKK